MYNTFYNFVSIILNKITRCVQCIAQDEQMIPFINKKGRGHFCKDIHGYFSME